MTTSWGASRGAPNRLNGIASTVPPSVPDLSPPPVGQGGEYAREPFEEAIARQDRQIVNAVFYCDLTPPPAPLCCPLDSAGTGQHRTPEEAFECLRRRAAYRQAAVVFYRDSPPLQQRPCVRRDFHIPPPLYGLLWGVLIAVVLIAIFG